MRVHHIINDYNVFTGGAQRVVRALHTGLIERGIESHIFALLRQEDHPLPSAQSLGLHSPYDLKAFLGIRRYIADHVRPDDVIHVHLFPSLIYVSWLALLGQVPCRLICTEHSTSNRRRGTLLGRILDMFTYAGYQRVIAISAGVEQELLSWMPSLQGKTTIIFNGADLAFTQPIAHEAKTIVKVLSVGTLRTAKNYVRAIKAIALLNDLDVEYHIAGVGEMQDELIRLVREQGLESKIRFLGYIDSLPERLASADIFLMPSLWEGFGLAAVEAMNASLPSVVSDVPGLREIVNCDPPCALLVDPQSPASIADALRQLILSPALRLQFGARAFDQSQKFGNDTMIAHYIRLYESLY
jgi:glycosyltransferase involved in cell wall biosynthesis